MEFSGLALSCFTYFRSTVFTEALPVKSEDPPMPLFQAIPYSGSWVMKLVNRIQLYRTKQSNTQ